MKIDELIDSLQKLRFRYGNIGVVMSIDPEGNSYSTLDGKWSFGLIREGEDAFLEKMIKAKKLKGMDDEEKKFLKRSVVIGVCLIPFYEGFETAEKAVKEETIDPEG